MDQTLDARQLEELLDEILETEFSYRNTTPPAQSLAALPAAVQHYAIDWVRRVASTNIELGYQYACHAAEVLGHVEREMVEAWILHAMDVYDREGLHRAKLVVEDLDRFIHTRRGWTCGCLLEQSEGVLHGFLQGLSGRRLKLAEAEEAHTDTETLFLPPVIALLDNSKDNFLLYKATIAQLWAQTRFGTFRESNLAALAEQHEAFLTLFHALESLRLETRIERELPGLYRDMQRIAEALEQPRYDENWLALRHELASARCDTRRVLELTDQLLASHAPPPPNPWHGILRPDLAAERLAARIEREKMLLKVRLKELEEEIREQPSKDDARKGFSLKKSDNTEEHDDQEMLEGMELLLDDRPMPLPDEMRDTLSSIMLDLGEIPDDYLEPAGEGEYDPRLFGDDKPDADSAWSGTYHEEGAHLYPEWDFRRKAYRKNWCAARELELPGGDPDFAAATLDKYRGLIKHLRRTFEAMRDEDKRLKRQTDGDEVDLDALVEALADARDGSEMSDRLFTRDHRSERNIAVAFMVDMSGSTKGWINDAERESLILLCEALETLGDRYAIYGFSSITRKRCELYHVKHFEEPYDDQVSARIAAIEAKDYTRMGFAVRHLTKILGGIDARTRVLITLSDGKPDDYDNYRGDYGIEDTRRALIEARRAGVHPYCITIDREARDYLPHLYGPAAWTLIDEVRALPLKVSDIYRRLTT